MTFLMMLSNYANCADDTTLSSKCDHVSDLWQQLELASELESHLQDIVDWVKNGLVDFNGSIDVKMDGSVLEEKSSWCWGWPPVLNWIEACTLSLFIAKTASKKLEL